MNKEWSEINKTMQNQIKQKETFNLGIKSLFSLRNDLWKTVLSFKEELTKDDFSVIPYMNANGYHSKTIAYSLYHIFRIEDIVAHTLIKEDEQIFFKGNYQKKISSPIITTGNELFKEEIREFSKKLNIDELYNYIFEVKQSTEKLLKELSYDDLKRKISIERKEILKTMHVVSEDENAIWLIDYWCNKDFKGLIQMPFSRHWIMHIEACMRIKKALK